MAQLAISAVGAAVGFAVGGPVGAQFGWAIGSVVGAQFGPKQKSEGPRLQDLKVTGSEYGQTIPWAAGHPRIAGQVWWASQRREISTTTSQGKGGGGAESTSYTYEVDILYGLVNREILGVSRIWSNGKLIWTSLADSDEDSVINSQNEAPWDRITVYTGESTQLPDPTYEAAVTNAPAYRGRGSVFIEGLQLGNSGVIPNLTFEVVIDGNLVNLDKGFLSQFDALTDATHVDTQLGPEPALLGGAALNTSVKKWGASSLYVPSGGSAITPLGSPVNNGHTGKSWRFECWVYWTGNTDSTAVINIKSASDDSGVAFGRHGAFAAYWASVSSSVSGTSGVFGLAADRPPINTWVHVAIEQVYGQTVKLYDSNKGGLVTELTSTIHVFGNSDMGEVRIQAPGGAAPFYVDSMLFRWFEDDEADLLYANGYSVPTGPFEPPPYAYQTIDPNDDTLQNVVEDLCEAAGMPVGAYDATALSSITKPVRSFVLSQVATSRSAIEQLMAGYFFEAYLTDKLYFVPRAGSVADTIDADDMGAGLESPEDETLPTQVGSDLEIPAQVSVSYSNVDADYTTATEHSDRLLSGQVSTSVVQLPLGFTAAEAKGIADAIVVDGYVSRVTGTFSVPLAYAERTPTDVVAVPDADGSVYRVRIVRRTDEGPLLKFEWVLDDASAIESAGITSDDYTPTVDVALPGDTIMQLLDIPLMRDAENKLGHYVAATSSGTTWPGASINRSLDDVEYAEAARVSERAILGATTTTLGNFTGVGFDEVNTVTVTLSYGTLSSSTRAGLLADASVNNIMIGAELVRFRTATFVSDGVYTLSGLLRGQKGTEWAMAGHASADVVVLIQTAGIRYVAIDLPSLSAERFYKGGTLGKSLASVSGESFTCEGVSLKPLAPVDVRASKDPYTGAATITWKRRTRMSSRMVGAAGVSVPLGEASESYSVRIYSDAGFTTLKRTLTTTTQSATYTQSQQVADFGSSSSSFYVRVAQVSAVVGAGYEASAAVSLAASVGGITALSPILFAGSASGWLACTTSYQDSGVSGVINDLRITSFWKATARSGPYMLTRSVTTRTTLPTIAPAFSPVMGRIAQTSTYVLQLTWAQLAGIGEQVQLIRSTLDLSADPATVTPSITFAAPRILAGEASRFLLFGDTSKVHSSADGVTWTLIGTMSGATFPHDIGDATYTTHGIQKIGSRWFLVFGLGGGTGANADRLFYSDNADAQTGWTATSGITVTSTQSLHEEVVYDGAKHYAAVTDFAAGTTTIYASSDGGVTWASEYVTATGTGFETSTSGTTGAFMVHFQITGTTGSDYVRAYTINGVVYEKLVGTTSWSAKASGLVNPAMGFALNGGSAFFDKGVVFTAGGSQVRAETAGVCTVATGF